MHTARLPAVVLASAPRGALAHLRPAAPTALVAQRSFASSPASHAPPNLPAHNPFLTNGAGGADSQAGAYAPLTPAERNRPNELRVAQQGSNQLSLETPNNGAGACPSTLPTLASSPSIEREGAARLTSVANPTRRRIAEYVLTGLDKIVNWARQGSMWPMTCALPVPVAASGRDRPVEGCPSHFRSLRSDSASFALLLDLQSASHAAPSR